MNYTLNRLGEPVACDDVMKWAEWYESARADGSLRVALDHVGGFRISTVFLSLDHGFNIAGDDDYQPILWETMIFRECDESRPSEYDEFQRRYTSREDAIQGHKEAVAAIVSEQQVN